MVKEDNADVIHLESGRLRAMAVAEAMKIAERPIPNVKIDLVKMMRGDFMFASPNQISEPAEAFGKVLGRVTSFRTKDSVIAYPQFKMCIPPPTSVEGDLDQSRSSEEESSYDLHIVLRADFHVAYTIINEDRVDDFELEVFSKINSIFVAWPYLREFVSNCAARMNESLPAIGLLSPNGAARYAGISADAISRDNASD